MPSTNLNRLENWLGAANVAALSHAMNNPAAKWYGPPIAVHGVPGDVFATADGDFIGNCRMGFEATARDYADDMLRRIRRAARIATGPEKRARLNAGFASLSDLISEVTQNAKRQELYLHKVGSTGVVNATNTLWRVGDLPQAGAAGSAAPGGRACTSSTAGAFNAYQNAAGGDTTHFVSANIFGTAAPNTLLLYDRIFDVAKTMSSSTTEAVTGVPTRYQSATAADADYIGGNFGFIECNSQLSATAHNWATCNYVKEDGSTGQALPSLTGNSTCIIDRLDQPTGQWFVPLVAGDVGIMKWTQMQCSSNAVTGGINFCIGHPLAWIPCPIAALMCPVDGINTAFSLVRIFDNACLAFLEVMKGANTATTYAGGLLLASG